VEITCCRYSSTLVASTGKTSSKVVFIQQKQMKGTTLAKYMS
jgi:hypothetical protein